MRRVVLGAVLLTGVLVLSMVGLLENSARDKPLSLAVVAIENVRSGYRLHSYFPDTRYHAQLTPLMNDRVVLGMSADGLWVYVFGQAMVLPPHVWDATGIYKVRLDGRRAERLATVDALWYIAWSPDRKWIVYLDTDSDPFQPVLMKLPLDGQPAEAIMAWPFDYTPTGMAISPDGRQLAFSVVPNGTLASEVFIVPITGGVPQNLTENYPGDFRLALWTSPDEWLVLYESNHYVAMRPDGSDLRQVLPVAVNTDAHGKIEWVKSARLLVVRGTYNYWAYGVHIGEDRPTWGIEGTVVISPDAQSVIYQSTNGSSSLWKAPITGGTAQEIITLSSMDVGLAISPDSRYALVATFVENYDSRQLLRVDLQDGTVKTLYTQFFNAVPNFAWSSDSQWVSFYDGANSGNYADERLVMLRADGSERYPLNFAAGRAYPSWLQAPPLDFASRSLILMGAGLIGLSVVLTIVRSRKNS